MNNTYTIKESAVRYGGMIINNHRGSRMTKRKLDKPKYFAVFAITSLIFIAGILLGNHFSSKKMEQIDRIGSTLKTDTMAMELQYELIAEDPCKYINSTPLAEELYEMASKLDYMENRLGQNDESVKDLKRYYSLLEIQHWLFMKKINKECGQNKSLILFFYTNEDDCPSCKEQGFILTWLRRNYADIYIYSFDYTLENPALETLKTMFSITETPATVIDGQTYHSFMTKAELQKIMEEKGLPMIQ